jgi:hypothetical protein
MPLTKFETFALFCVFVYARCFYEMFTCWQWSQYAAIWKLDNGLLVNISTFPVVLMAGAALVRRVERKEAANAKVHQG